VTDVYRDVHRRVSVLRGRVLSQQGLGVVGVRVSVERHPRFGFTLTRNGGWYCSAYLQSELNEVDFAKYNIVIQVRYFGERRWCRDAAVPT